MTGTIAAPRQGVAVRRRTDDALALEDTLAKLGWYLCEWQGWLYSPECRLGKAQRRRLQKAVQALYHATDNAFNAIAPLLGDAVDQQEYIPKPLPAAVQDIVDGFGRFCAEVVRAVIEAHAALDRPEKTR